MPLLGVLLGLTICGSSLGPPQTVVLTYKRFEGCAGRYSYSGYYASFLPEGANDGGPEAPAGTVKPLFFDLYGEGNGYAGPQRRLHGVVAKSSVKAVNFDRMWIDWNSNGRYDSGECATLRARRDGSSIFVPKKQPEIDGVRGPIRYRLANDTVTIEPAGYREGVVKIGGRSVKVGVVDGNLDGVYGGGDERGGSRDFMLVDYDGRGLGGGSGAEAQYLQYPGASAPLGGRVLMPDKAFYSVRVSPTGRRIVLRKVVQPMGAISVKGGTIPELSLSGSHGAILTRSIGGACPVPADTYHVSEVYVARNKWAYALSLPERTLTVHAGKTVQIAAGLPMKLALTVQSSPGRFDFSAEAKAASGASVEGVYAPSGDRAPPPTLSIRDRRGRVVKGAAFEYG